MVLRENLGGSAVSDAVHNCLRLSLAVLCVSILLFAISEQNSLAAAPAQDRIVLPLELIAGQPATLAALKVDGHVASGIRIILSSGQILTTDESGRAHFLVPPQTGPLLARIIGSEVREAADVLPEQSSSGALQLTEVPRVASSANLLVIAGSGFDGDADENAVAIEGKPAFVLASSPVQLILMPPPTTATGSARLLITKGKTEVAGSLTFVNIIPISSSSIQIRAGKTAALALLVEGTADPVHLEIEDLTPQIAQFAHGNKLFVRTAGGPDNSAVLWLKGLAPGRFAYSVALRDILTGAGVQVASDFLRAANVIAGPDQRRKIESILTQLERKHSNLKTLRAELQNIAESTGPSDFQTLVYAAERSLDGD